MFPVLKFFKHEYILYDYDIKKGKQRTDVGDFPFLTQREGIVNNLSEYE